MKLASLTSLLSHSAASVAETTIEKYLYFLFVNNNEHVAETAME